MLIGEAGEYLGEKENIYKNRRGDQGCCKTQRVPMKLSDKRKIFFDPELLK